MEMYIYRFPILELLVVLFILASFSIPILPFLARVMPEELTVVTFSSSTSSFIVTILMIVYFYRLASNISSSLISHILSMPVKRQHLFLAFVFSGILVPLALWLVSQVIALLFRIEDIRASIACLAILSYLVPQLLLGASLLLFTLLTKSRGVVLGLGIGTWIGLSMLQLLEAQIISDPSSTEIARVVASLIHPGKAFTLMYMHTSLSSKTILFEVGISTLLEFAISITILAITYVVFVRRWEPT